MSEGTPATQGGTPIDASEIVAGDRIRNADLRELTVLSVEADTRPQIVHNLEIADAHTYFAGEFEAWGHNKKKTHGNSDSCSKPAILYRLFSGKEKFLKWGIINNLKRRQGEHRRALGDPGARALPMMEGARCDIRQTERYLEATQPGPLNKTPWSGSGRF